MEKNNDSVIVKIVSVAALLAALALILILLLRGDLFSGLVADINSTKEGYEAATIYDVCYYNAWNIVYGVAYAVALFTTVLAPVALMLKYNGAAMLAQCAAIVDIVLAVMVLFAKILGTNGFMHRVAAHMYLGETGSVDTYNDFLGIVPMVCAIVMLVLAVLTLVLVHTGKLHKIKLFNNDGPREIVRMIIPVLYGSIVLETVRPLVVSAVCDKVGGASDIVNTFVMDYYFAGSGAWGFNVPYVWFVITMAIAVVVANRYLKKHKDKVMPVVLSVVAAFYVIRCVIYLMNPPRLFGYLTLDEAVCDATELAYPLYMVMLVTDVFLLMLLTHWCTKKELAKRTLFIIIGCHMVVSLVAVLAVKAGISLVYGICLVANILALVGSFYMAYIRGRHH